MAKKPRSDHWRNESEYLPSSLEDLVELRRRLMEAGYSASVANGMIGWLLSKAAGEPDVTAGTTRSRYRKILAELDYLAPDPDPDRLVARAEDVVDVDEERQRRRPSGPKRALGPAARKTVAIVALAAAAAGLGGARAERAEAAQVRPLRPAAEVVGSDHHHLTEQASPARGQGGLSDAVRAACRPAAYAHIAHTSPL